MIASAYNVVLTWPEIIASLSQFKETLEEPIHQIPAETKHHAA